MLTVVHINGHRQALMALMRSDFHLLRLKEQWSFIEIGKVLGKQNLVNGIHRWRFWWGVETKPEMYHSIVTFSAFTYKQLTHCCQRRKQNVLCGWKFSF